MDRKEYYRQYNAKRKEKMAEYDQARKETRKLRERIYRAKNPDRYQSYQKTNYDKNKEKWTPVSTEMTMLKGSKTRAIRKNLPHNITLEDIVIPEYCPIFNEIKLCRDNTCTHFDSPTLDRIKPELGYIKGNIAVISHQANSIKSFGTAEQHRRIADWIEQQ